MNYGSDIRVPPEKDFGFYERRKHGRWLAVEAPHLAVPVADTHNHLHSLPDPAWELVRCAAHNVMFSCEVVNPLEEGLGTMAEVARWQEEARAYAEEAGIAQLPRVRIAAGVHPHNATGYSDEVEHELRAALADPRIAAVGEVGLDYHYDFSPREAQRDAFRRQIRLAHETGLPLMLHLRGGDDLEADDAHGEAFSIMEQEGWPAAGTLLHCCTVGPQALAPWVEAGCYVAYGGAITFKSSDDIRAGVALVPPDKLLTETDSPYMAPVPMRSTACTPAHTVFTAAYLAQLRGCDEGEQADAFLQQLWDNAIGLLDRPPTAFQQQD